jgi:hypothetical protein
LRLLLLRNEAATSEIIPALSIRSSKLIGNQLGLHAVYMASVYPSEMIRIMLPFDLQHYYPTFPNKNAFKPVNSLKHSEENALKYFFKVNLMIFS